MARIAILKKSKLNESRGKLNHQVTTAGEHMSQEVAIQKPSAYQRLSMMFVRWRHYLPDIFASVASAYVSLFLRVDINGFFNYLSVLSLYLPVFILIRFSLSYYFGIYDIVWRFVSAADAIKLIRTNIFSTLAIIVFAVFIDLGNLPRSYFVIDLFLVTGMMAGFRLSRRIIHENKYRSDFEEFGRRTLIFGAGTDGISLARRIRNHPSYGYHLFGFIDDNPEYRGRLIDGIKVIGNQDDLKRIMVAEQIQELIISTQLDGKTLRKILAICRECNIRPRMYSSIADKRMGASVFQMTRELDLADLLSRPRREMDQTPVREFISGKTILVTGAGGSIGSELCRQIYQMNPAHLLILDNSELNLYSIDKELRVSHSESSLVVPLLIDMKDKESLRGVFERYAPDVVIHAAAYKHVHLVEANPFSAILNNIGGTANLISLSQEFSVEDFVLISSDKAVNPGGVMGATKRVCELLIHEAGQNSGGRYCAVRFGNVLGSSGSLIPILKKQIENGEPVTITHEDMTRYFMLIPEAVGLVLRAATIAQPGEIAILKMGEPVRIVDVARNLIALMGKKEEDVPIVFTGIRPGEKLFEELYLTGNEINTSHEDILVLPGAGLLPSQRALLVGEVPRIVDQLLRLAEKRDKTALSELQLLVKGHLPEFIRSDFATEPSLPNQ